MSIFGVLDLFYSSVESKTYRFSFSLIAANRAFICSLFEAALGITEASDEATGVVDSDTAFIDGRSTDTGAVPDAS